jgi:hypothetical protein
MHFFNPAPLMPLVEIVRAKLSSDESVEAAFAVGERLGKQPIRCHDTPGFVVNRVLIPLLNDCIRVLDEARVVRFEKLPTVALPSPYSPAILAFVRRFNESLSVCRGIFRKFNPQVVLGMGGFTSTAPVIAGRMRGIPTFIHESNAFPGKANRHTARLPARGTMEGKQLWRIHDHA